MLPKWDMGESLQDRIPGRYLHKAVSHVTEQLNQNSKIKLYAIIAHAGSSRVSKAVTHICDSISLYVYLHNKTEMAETKIAKLGIGIVRRCIGLSGQNVKGWSQECRRGNIGTATCSSVAVHLVSLIQSYTVRRSSGRCELCSSIECPLVIISITNINIQHRRNQQTIKPQTIYHNVRQIRNTILINTICQ